MNVVQAYRFALDATPTQERDLALHAGAARFAFNWGLGLVRVCLAQRDAERSYGIPDEQLTGVPWTLKLHESARKLARRLEAGTARILSATAKLDGGRWFVSFTCEVDRQIGTAVQPDATVGADVGVKHLAGLHKLTTALARQFGTVVVEDLNVAGMVRNRRLAKAISDAGFAEIRRQLAYKTAWHGGRLVVADRFYPSSKTCAGCGAVKAKLPLRVRTFQCETCGMVADRDVNAARNLAQLVTSTTGTGVAGDPGPKGPNGRGADRKTPLAGQVAVKRPPGTVTAGQTGTVPPRGGTADCVLTREH